MKIVNALIDVYVPSYYICSKFCFSLMLSALNLQPPAGTPVPGKGVVVCKYPYDPSVALGYSAFALHVACMIAGLYSLFYPYKGKDVPKSALFQNKGFFAFFAIAL